MKMDGYTRMIGMYDMFDALDLIRQALKEGLENRHCTDVCVEVHNTGELEVSFNKNGEEFSFYFG